MYGGQAKLGRGGGGRGGGGAGKRHSLPSSFSQPPINRQSHGPSGGRLSIGGAPSVRNRGVSAAGSNAITCPSSTTEETFSLVTGNPLNFAMIIRLVPDLVDEIKRVEDQGGTARIKFDSNAKNPSENVIEVGGKVYRFTWSHETGDLCDIYEERQSGEDGNGLLVESGCAWRKVNVQRTLDESTKNHVKMRSEEAERKLKSRKAIILDHANPSMKNQRKAVAAAETANAWKKSSNQKKESDLKRRKVDPPAVVGPLKAANKIVSSSTIPAKSRPSVSPLPSPPEHSIIPGSPFGLGNLAKHSSTGQITTEVAAPCLEKELTNRTTSTVIQDKSGPKGQLLAKPTDLQSMLTSLLTDNPKGMSLKALERAVGESMPNSARKIEPIIKKIANFEAPGKYILKQLKPGVELGSGKKPASGIGSSPEDASHQTPPFEDNFDCIPAAKIDSTQRAVCQEMEKQVKLNAECEDEVIPTHCLDHSFDIFGEKRNSDNSEKEACSSSDSGSDSDSESGSSDSRGSSESGSHSRGRSKSKSGSGSSSDSDSDDSKEGSDVDVDIMTSEEDQEAKQKLLTSSSPIILEDSSTVAAENGIAADMQDGGSDLVDIEKDTPDNDKMEMSLANSDINKESKKYMEYHESPVSLVNQSSLGPTTKDTIKHRQTDSHTKLPKGKHKRSFETNNTFEKPENAKRPKTGEIQISETRNSLSMESPQKPFINKSHSAQHLRTYRDGPSDSDFQKNHNEQIPGRKPIASNSRLKGPATAERPNMHSDGFGHNSLDYAERNTHAHGVKKNKFAREGQDEMHHVNEKNISRNPIEDKCQIPLETLYQKHGEQVGKIKESAQFSKPLTIFSLKDNERTDTDRYPSAIQGRGRTLQRELSELELGEFRESLLEVTPGVEKQIVQNNPLKQSEDKSITDPIRGKPDGRKNLDQGKKTIPILNNQESLVKKKILGNHTDSPKAGKSQQADMSVKPRNNEVGGSQDFSVEGGDINRKLAPKNTELLFHPSKNGRKQKSNMSTDLNGQQKATSLTESTEGGGLKRRESSSDENSCSYSKYEKASPELKGPIKDFSQYKEYVQEYQAKYNSYCSLNKILEDYRNEFLKLGRELESAKGKDMACYNIILGKLNESYLQSGARHKRLKKIFIILHEELKNLKQMIKGYATSYANESISKS